ncbi:MAG TPA: tetratricopeptide repeat protein [bacterium]
MGPTPTQRNAGPGRERAAAALLALLLIAAVFAVYGQTVGFGYVFDDRSYIIGNPGFKKGLTREGIRWAFTASYHANWHPLAWIAHLADRAVFGDAAGPAHLVNAGLHAACSALLFVVLRRLTGSLLPSALGAALFALHPLRVESVAWVTERKDPLSTIFWLLAIAAYVGYARRPGPRRYALVALWLALGLLTKAMVVTLPAALLLLDAWPLGRLRPGRPGGTRPTRLLLEKVPLLLLSAGGAAGAVISQGSAGAMQNLEHYPVAARLANAVISCVAYLADTVWPAGLAVFYPHPGTHFSLGLALGATAALVAVTALTLRLWRRAPALATGWLWFLGTLTPVIGLIQVGAQARADRYTYLPSIGLSLAVVWIAAPAARRLRRPALATAAALALLLALGTASWLQAAYWRDEVALYRRALAVTERNWMAENNLGWALQEQGDLDAAMGHYRNALETRPHFDAPHFNLGRAYARLGRNEEALEEFDLALQIRPDFGEDEMVMADLLSTLGRKQEAIAHYRNALRSLPEVSVLHMNLGNALSDVGAYDEALAQYAEAIRLEPNDALAWANRGLTLQQMGRAEEASADFRRALAIDPQCALARRYLGLP